MRATIAILAAAIGALGLTTPASANTAAFATSERVSYADLDLATTDGQAALQKRVDRAAWRVCRTLSDGSTLNAEGHDACYREARQRINVQIAQLASDRARGG
jgi:UrcA family protein